MPPSRRNSTNRASATLAMCGGALNAATARDVTRSPSEDLKITKTALQRKRPKAVMIKRSLHGLLKKISTTAAVEQAPKVSLVDIIIHVIGDRHDEFGVARINLLFAVAR